MTNNQITYKRLGDYIREVNVRNRELKVNLSQGICNDKYFQNPKQVADNPETHKIVRTGQFAYNRATTRNGDKLSIALRQGPDCTVSAAYQVFEVSRPDLLLPEYLMMWFKRPEFDRLALFYSHGSAHEFFEWESMCDVQLPVPNIERQREIVAEYETLARRIRLNEQMIEKLEATAQALYRHTFVDNIDKQNLPQGWHLATLGEVATVKGGKRLPKGEELQTDRTDHPFIKVADMCNSKYMLLTSSFQYVSDAVQKQIRQYIVNTNDIILSIVGTIGRVNVIDESLDNANLTENCVKLINLRSVSYHYLYAFLSSNEGQQTIEQSMVGGVQAKLPIYNIERLEVVVPNKLVLSKFDMDIGIVDGAIKNKQQENIKLTELQSLLLAKMGKEK